MTIYVEATSRTWHRHEYRHKAEWTIFESTILPLFLTCTFACSDTWCHEAEPKWALRQRRGCRFLHAVTAPEFTIMARSGSVKTKEKGALPPLLTLLVVA